MDGESAATDVIKEFDKAGLRLAGQPFKGSGFSDFVVRREAEKFLLSS